MRRLICLLAALWLLWPNADARAQALAAPPTPEQLHQLAALLRDPAIQAWLEAEARNGVAPSATAPAEAAAMLGITGRVDAMRAFTRQLFEAIPQIPAELARAWLIFSLDLTERGVVSVLILLCLFIGVGFLAQALYWWATRGLRRSIIDSPLDSVGNRLRTIGKRGLFGLGWVLSIALGSIGGFLLFDWPPLLKEVVLGYLIVFLIFIATRVLARFLLAPGAERFRIVPMSSAAAWFWASASMLLVGWFFFIKVTLELLHILGTSPPAVYAVGMGLGLTLLAATLWVVWRHPPTFQDRASRSKGQLPQWLLSGYLAAVWLALFTGTPTLFYVGIILLLVPILIRAGNRAVNHVLRPADTDAMAAPAPSIVSVTLERGLRAALLIAGAYLLAYVLDIDFGALTTRDTAATRLLRGAINAVVILLVADLAWNMLRAWIDGTLAEAAIGTSVDAEEVRRRARLRTLLPILRNVSFVVLIAMGGLMALSALGVQIGPLIAGAGVVGVAVGFGAQTLVKDVISGMFYLLDDAFRVGEYIQSGSYKGTVESFSLRSVKLRHHRGPLYTVPFGELGAVQNMSRDWVIDKLSVGVTYDTDLDKVKKVIKKISAELLADPELAPHFLEPLKMQGVDAFGDFAIQVRMKMMTKPGEQFVIRRRANALIKKAFAANGIQFAFPTVTVAGNEGEANAAIAQKALDIVAPQPAS